MRNLYIASFAVSLCLLLGCSSCARSITKSASVAPAATVRTAVCLPHAAKVEGEGLRLPDGWIAEERGLVAALPAVALALTEGWASSPRGYVAHSYDSHYELLDPQPAKQHLAEALARLGYVPGPDANLFQMDPKDGFILNKGEDSFTQVSVGKPDKNSGGKSSLIVSIHFFLRNGEAPKRVTQFIETIPLFDPLRPLLPALGVSPERVRCQQFAGDIKDANGKHITVGAKDAHANFLRADMQASKRWLAANGYTPVDNQAWKKTLGPGKIIDVSIGPEQDQIILVAIDDPSQTGDQPASAAPAAAH